MPKIIDHQKRKKEILRKALSLFAREGYVNTNLSQLASECGISRPTLYLYFKDKEEIFHYAVKQFTFEMFAKYRRLSHIENKTSTELLLAISYDIVDKSNRNSEFLSTMADFLIQMRRQGRNYSDIIRRRTVRLEYLFAQLLRHGIEKGEFVDLPLKETVLHLYNLIESYIFRLVLFGKSDTTEFKTILQNWLKSISKTSS